jgi:hypothetical protein
MPRDGPTKAKLPTFAQKIAFNKFVIPFFIKNKSSGKKKMNKSKKRQKVVIVVFGYILASRGQQTFRWWR